MNRISLTEQLSQIQNCSNFSKNTLTRFFESIFDHISINYEKKFCFLNQISINFEKKVCNLKIFTLYLNLPMILSKRLFKIFLSKDVNVEEQFITVIEFVEILLKFYFGSLDELIEIFFKLFNTKNNNVFNFNDFMLVIKFLTNDEILTRKFEQSIKHFNKKTNSKSDFENFKNYIYYEDTCLIINLYKLIIKRQPFTNNVIKYFELLNFSKELTEDDETFANSDSDETSTKHEEILDLADYLEKNKFCTLYKFINSRFVKFKAVVSDKNIFLLKSNHSKSKNYTFTQIIPAEIYLFSKAEASLNLRKLVCITLQLKVSKKADKDITSNSEKLYFKSHVEADHFLELIEHQIIEFFKLHSAEEVIGEGEYGKVMLVSHNLTKEKFAVKIINKNTIRNDSLLMNEVGTLTFIKSNPHKNIVKVYEIFEDKDSIYVVMEYLQNNLTTLLNAINKDEQKVDIVRQISNGLLFLHSNGIIHRDIKSDNIMIDEENRVKIVDFGFSKVLLEKEQTNESYGTLLYAAPEIIKRKYYTNKVDIWSLGNLMFQIHYKYLPFDLGNFKASDIANKICNNCLTLNDSKLDKIIEGCLKKDNELRFSIRELIEALK